MSIRRDVERQLAANPDQIIPVSRQGRKDARKELQEARIAYEKAREKVLLHELPRYYRVAIYGSARLAPDSDEFKFVTDLSKELVKARDVDIVTGGGPGIMEAANYGAKLAIQEGIESGKEPKAKSHGLSVKLPWEEQPNEHLDKHVEHPDFSTRLQDFIDRTQATYLAPGGFGTTLEDMMVAQAIQVNHFDWEYPLVAHPFWKDIIDPMIEKMYYERAAAGRTPLINENDADIIKFSDNIPEIVSIISGNYDVWKSEINSRVRKIP